MKDFTYELTNKFEFANNSTADSVTCYSPSRLCKNDCRQLQQEIMHVFKEQESSGTVNDDSREKSDVTEITGDFYLLMIMRSEKVDYAAFMKKLEDIVKVSSKLNNQAPIQDGHIEKMGDEWDELVGEYLKNFIIPSAIMKMMQS